MTLAKDSVTSCITIWPFLHSSFIFNRLKIRPDCVGVLKRYQVVKIFKQTQLKYIDNRRDRTYDWVRNHFEPVIHRKLTNTTVWSVRSRRQMTSSGDAFADMTNTCLASSYSIILNRLTFTFIISDLLNICPEFDLLKENPIMRLLIVSLSCFPKEWKMCKIYT